MCTRAFTSSLQVAHDLELAHSLQLMLAEEEIQTEEYPEHTEPTEPMTMEATAVKVEVKDEEEDEWEQTAWWQPPHNDEDCTWYWEGVETEEEDADVAVVGCKPPQPPQPKAMPMRDPPPPPPAADPPAGNPLLPAWDQPPPPPPPVKGCGKAPWAFETKNDRVLRVDKHGGKVYKSGWYQDRWGRWWETLDFVLGVAVCLRLWWYVSFWYCFCFGVGCTLFAQIMFGYFGNI